MKVNFTRYKDNKYLFKMLRYIIIVLSLITFICTIFLGEDTFLNGFIIFACLVLITLSIYNLR